MDPTENLRQQQELAQRIVTDPDARFVDGHQLAELVLAYFDWRRAGGFAGMLPEGPSH